MRPMGLRRDVRPLFVISNHFSVPYIQIFRSVLIILFSCFEDAVRRAIMKDSMLEVLHAGSYGGGEMRVFPCTLEAHASSAKCLGEIFGCWSELYPSCSCIVQMNCSFVFFCDTRRPLIAIYTHSLATSDPCYSMHR